MTPRTWRVATLCLLVASLSLLGYLLFSRASGGFAPDTVITQVQKLSRLVTVRYRIQRVVGMTEVKDPVGEESILLMVEGEVQAGVDLQHLTPADVTRGKHGEVTVTLPPPSIVSASLDESKTKVWDRHITWWTPWVPYDPDLEHKARLKAAEDIRKAALEMGILEQARTNARTALQDLFGTLGWKVNVKVRGFD